MKIINVGKPPEDITRIKKYIKYITWGILPCTVCNTLMSISPSDIQYTIQDWTTDEKCSYIELYVYCPVCGHKHILDTRVFYMYTDELNSIMQNILEE